MTPAEPLGGDAGRLLDNMLRAMQLHRHPRVFLAALERSAPGTEASADIPASLADAVAQLQPAMVLVLGHVAARAALGRTEPLGRLRAGPHVLAGCPAVVTYDPAFLLRSQDNKAAAWADLIMFTMPDELQAETYKKYVHDNLREGAAIEDFKRPDRVVVGTDEGRDTLEAALRSCLLTDDEIEKHGLRWRVPGDGLEPWLGPVDGVSEVA